MSNSPRTDAFMINNRFPAVFELAKLSAEIEEEVTSLRKEIEYLKHEMSLKDVTIKALEEQLCIIDDSAVE